MKKPQSIQKIVSVMLSVLVLGAALPSYASEEQVFSAVVQPMPSSTATVLITEVQTGAATASDEFIELYNRSANEVLVGGWQIRYVNAASSGQSSTLLAEIPPDIRLQPDSYYVLHTSTVSLPEGVAGQEYIATLSGADKAIALFAPDIPTCQLRVHDALAWGTSMGGEGTAIAASDVTTHKHAYRYVDDTGTMIDTDNNAYDAGIALPVASTLTIGAKNSQRLPVAGAEVGAPLASSLPPVAIRGCTVTPPDSPTPSSPPAPTPPASSPPSVDQPEQPDVGDGEGAVLPPRNLGLMAPQISELLPNPAKPQTDANDEFIELYNANTADFDLSGFVLEAGATSKRRYTFPEGTLLAPKSFQAFMSRDTHLALSNTAGQVRLIDPYGTVIVQSEPYQTAKDGHAWLYANNRWQWTTVSTPGAMNVIKTPAAKTTARTTATTKTTSATVKGASTAQSASDTTAAAKTDAVHHDEGGGFNPLHPGILALTGVLAVLYAVYEYRRDLANKFHQFRANRAARRSLRQKPEGR